MSHRKHEKVNLVGGGSSDDDDDDKRNKAVTTSSKGYLAMAGRNCASRRRKELAAVS